MPSPTTRRPPRGRCGRLGADATGPARSSPPSPILTDPRGYDDWSITHVDWILSVGSDYKPPDLVSVRDAGVRGSGLVRKVAFADLREMATYPANLPPT